MGSITLNGSALGGSLKELLMCPDIEPGSEVSYQTAKTIYSFHPLGKKLADTPIQMAQSRGREIVVQNGPEEDLKEAFEKEWKALDVNRKIKNLGGQARVYGISSLAILTAGDDPAAPLDYDKLADAVIAINLFDPLNTAGSLVLNQNPNAMDYQKVGTISVQGQTYHRSRFVTLLHEEPLYIEYTVSAYGFVGRSVYQRCLFPLKSYVQTMITNDMVSVKAGVLIAMLKAVGSWADGIIAAVAGIKRAIIREAVVGNVISIQAPDEKIESLNLQNINGAMAESRKNIIQDIASGADMPAIIINDESFAQGFSDGTEDANYLAGYVEGVRDWIDPAYRFFDQIVMHRAWTPGLYATLQKKYPERYRGVTYEVAFYDWKNSFRANWPNLRQEPDSEKIKVDAVKMQAAIDLLVTLGPKLDPDNMATLIQFVVDNFNSLKQIFALKLDLDMDLLLEHLTTQAENVQAMQEGGEDEDAPGQKPAGGARRITAGDAAIALLPDLRRERQERQARRDQIFGRIRG